MRIFTSLVTNRCCRPKVDKISLGSVAVYLILLLHAGLLFRSAAVHSPHYDEVAHIAAGISHWKHGTFGLFRVNPPLVRMVATLPLRLADGELETKRVSTVPGVRPEFRMGKQLLRRNGERSFMYVTIARWACVPFSVAGAFVCFRWARDLYGLTAGIMAASLWCFSPNVLAHASTISPDVGAAAMGVSACYSFWCWTKHPSWARALTSGCLLGIALLTKTTCIVFLLVLPVLWILKPNANPGSNSASWNPLMSLRRRKIAQLIFMFCMSLNVLNLGYGFDGSFRQLGGFPFISGSLSGKPQGKIGSDLPANAFAEGPMRHLPVPLPADYLLGIDQTKYEFEQKKWSYLGGEWRFGGWWYYYIYAMAIKVPVGTWLVLFVGMLLHVCSRRYRKSWWDECFLLTPIFVVLALVSSQTGYNHHLRYVLPVFPFAFIWMSKVAPFVVELLRQGRSGAAKHLLQTCLASLALLGFCWSIASSVRVYPHSMSYFNELVGGPENGHWHLGGHSADSNIDWGQDLLFLKSWYRRHPQSRPLFVAYNGPLTPDIVGIEGESPPTNREGPRPGWYAVSVNFLHSRNSTKDFRYLLDLEPTAMAGYSIYIYHITLDDANRVRRKTGLPEL